MVTGHINMVEGVKAESNSFKSMSETPRGNRRQPLDGAPR